MAKAGIIGGSGLGDALCAKTTGKPVRVDTPFGRPSGDIIETTWDGTDVAVLNATARGT